jgi:glucose/arabinose dehydrogenase
MVKDPGAICPSALFRLMSVLIAAAAVSCGGGSERSGDSNATGATRVGWDQQAADSVELASLHFAMYIDGTRTELPDASCSGPAAAAGFPCVASLPAMSNGRHTIELASYIVAGGIIESVKSAPIVINVSGSTVSAAASVIIDSRSSGASTSVAAPSRPRDVTAGDGTRLRVAVVTHVDRPSALAAAPDGTLFVGDRTGTVTTLRNGSTVTEGLSPEDGTSASPILDLAIDPQFARTRQVYVLDTGGDPAQPAFRLSRFRETAGRLGERAVLVDSVAAAADRPAAALSFGADDRLYLAVDDGGDPSEARRPSSYNGKVLRLSAEGTIAGDPATPTPVYAGELHAPRSLAWDPATGSLWVADAGNAGTSRLRGRDARTVVVSRYRLPLVEGAASVAVYRSSLIPSLQGNLLIAPLEDAAYLLRARFSGADQNTIASTERLTLPGAASVRVVEVAPDGVIFVGTDDAVLRLTPR